MILLVIRHGESEGDLVDVHEGRADFFLTQRGERQAKAMAQYVSERFTVTKIYSSSLRRARRVAEFLSESTQIPVECKDDLMEFNNGLLAGLPRSLVAYKYPEDKNLPADKSMYEMESMVEFRSRADRILNQVIEESSDEDVVALVTHGGMVNQLYRSFLGLPVDSNVFFATGDTGIHVWKVTDDRRMIFKANITEHTKGI